MKYYLHTTKKSNDDYYELHKSTCEYYQCGKEENFIYVGHFICDRLAILTAKARYPKYAKLIDGCIHCCPNINKK